MPQPPDRLTGLMDHLAALDPGMSETGRHRDGDVPGGRPRLFTLPVALRSAMVRVRPSAVLGALALLVVVLAVVGVRTAWAQRAAEPTAVTSSDVRSDRAATDTATDPSAQESDSLAQGPSTQAPSSQGPSAGDSATADVVPEDATAYVHVIGAVLQPGVVEVSAGDRVRDVVEAAGGLSDDADLSRINLARVVLDGEQIWVPVDGEDPPEAVAAAVPSGAATVPDNDGNAVPGPSASGPIDVNRADSASLQTLSGVGPVTAESIIAWRSENGRFSTLEELLEVSGIGPRTLEKLRPHLVVGP